jgi:hypothetical protein
MGGEGQGRSLRSQRGRGRRISGPKDFIKAFKSPPTLDPSRTRFGPSGDDGAGLHWSLNHTNFWLTRAGRPLCSLNIGDEVPYRNLMSGWPKANNADCRHETQKPRHERRRTPYPVQLPLFWHRAHTARVLARARFGFPFPSPRRAAHQPSKLRSSFSCGLASSPCRCQRMADRPAMTDRRPARPRRDASISGDEATYHVEKDESRWRVNYDDAPIGVFKDLGDAARFACDLARMQAQIGRVTWVVVLAEVEEVHRFEMRAVKPSLRHEARGPFGDDPGVTEASGWARSVFLRKG